MAGSRDESDSEFQTAGSTTATVTGVYVKWTINETDHAKQFEQTLLI